MRLIFGARLHAVRCDLHSASASASASPASALARLEKLLDEKLLERRKRTREEEGKEGLGEFPQRRTPRSTTLVATWAAARPLHHAGLERESRRRRRGIFYSVV